MIISFIKASFVKIILKKADDPESSAVTEAAQQQSSPTPANRFYRMINRLKIRNDLIREMLAEFVGIFILMTFGMASVAQAIFFQEKEGFNRVAVDVAWGFAVAFGAYASGKVSGGHLNPAVSIAMAVTGRFQWKKVIPYIFAQFVGSFFASAVVHGVYYDMIATTAPENTAGIFATYKTLTVTNRQCFIDQIVATGMLLLCILLLADESTGIPGYLVPLLVGLSVTTIGMTFGFNCGFPINPARDFAPRFYTFIAGWGSFVFSNGDYYFWIPIVGPVLGGIIGAWFYIGLVSFHIPSKTDIVLQQDSKL